MSSLQSILRYIDEDFAPPTVRLILVTKSGILLNKIVSKKSTLHDILSQEGLKEDKNYHLFGKPVNYSDKILDLIPKNYSNLSNIELIIEDKNIILEKEKIFYDKILKPFDNPFKVLVFTPTEFNVSIKSYPNETIKKFKLNQFSLKLSSYCNTPENLYISGGSGDDYTNINSGNKHFWKINSIKTNIIKLNDLPIDKQYHSMIYIPKRYIYFIGGNNRNTFYYDIFFSTFTPWANMNRQIKNPFLILVNHIYIYSFGNQDNNDMGNNLIFERTNLKSTNPKWELKVLQNQYLPLINFGGIGIGDEIFFLGGRRIRGEKMFKFNVTSENLEICKQENTKLIPLDKNFYELNEYNSVMIPDCQKENIQIIIYNKLRKKYRKVFFQKNFEEIINNDNLTNSNLDKSLIKENEQMKIVWKEYKNSYVDVNILPEHKILLPSVDELKQNIVEISNDIYGKKKIEDLKNENIDNNIYGSDNDINKEDQKVNLEKHTKNEEYNLKNINNNEDLNLDKRDLNEYENQLNIKEKVNDKQINDNLEENIIETNKNKVKENNNILLNEKLISSNENISLKQLFNQDINDKIDLKTKFKDFNNSTTENINDEKSMKNVKEEKNIIKGMDMEKNDVKTNEIMKEESNVYNSPTLYRKKTIIKQDKKNEIVIQCENSEDSPIKSNLKVNNKNKKNENINNNDSDTFNIEYNNEIIMGDKKGIMLSDIISGNSDLSKDKINKGLNNQLIVNVPKSTNNQKIEDILDNNNFIEEIKSKNIKKDDTNLNQINEKIDLKRLSNQPNSLENSEKDIDNKYNEENNNKLSEIIINETEFKDNNLKDGEIEKKNNNNEVNIINNKNLVEEPIEEEITRKEQEQIINDKNDEVEQNKSQKLNIRENNLYDKNDDNGDKINDDSIVLLYDKIVYNEKEKEDLKKIESAKHQKKEIECITGIIEGIPKQKIIEGDAKNKEEKIEMNIEDNTNVPQTINSIFKGNVNDEIILNKNNSNKPNIEDEKDKESIIRDNNGILSIKLSNKENLGLNLNKENNNKIEINSNQENEIHMPSNTFKESIPEINKNKNYKSIINEQNPELEKENPDNIESINNNKLSEINGIPKNENEIKIKQKEIKIGINQDNKDNNKEELKEEIIEGIIPGSTKNNNSKNLPIEKGKETEKDNLNKINKEKENNIYESFTGSIKGESSSKYLLEYGNTKGYKRPNIKKGKDFVHNPEILFEGTIIGKKKILPTLKSILQDNINDEILLNNNNSLKPSNYILSEADIPSYMKKLPEIDQSKDSQDIGSFKIEDSNIKMKGRAVDIPDIEGEMNNNDVKDTKLKGLNDVINSDVNIKINLNNDDIKEQEIKSGKIKSNKKDEELPENIELNILKSNNDLKAANIIGENSNNQKEEIKIEGLINGNVSDINIINNNNEKENEDLKLDILEDKIVYHEEDKDINENKSDLKSANLDKNINVCDIDNNNTKEEIIQGIIPGKTNKKQEGVKTNVPNINVDIDTDNNTKSEKIINEELNKETKKSINEKNSGSIKGKPMMKKHEVNESKNGNSKNEKLTNVKSEFIIEGIIEGNKKIPQTLKSIFEEKINNKIELKKESIKCQKIKIEDYQNNANEEIEIKNNSSLNSINPKVKNLQLTEILNDNNQSINGEKDEKLREKSKTSINKNIETNEEISSSLNKKGESITGIIPGINKNMSLNPDNNKLKDKSNKNLISGSINLDMPNINENKVIENNQNMDGNSNVDVNCPNLNQKSINSIKSSQSKASKGKDNQVYETITGTIKGIPKTKYLVEYGSTKGYKRPNIKKGKDFVHNPEILIEGTIIGKKRIPPTLKSLFQDKINTKIQLDDYRPKKSDLYNLKNVDISNYDLNLKQFNDINYPNLKLGKISSNIESDKAKKEEIISGKIKNIEINFKNGLKSNDSIKDSKKSEVKNNQEEESSETKNIKIPIEDIELYLPNTDRKEPSLKSINSKGNPNDKQTEKMNGIIISKKQDNINDDNLSIGRNKGTFININNRPNINNKKTEEEIDVNSIKNDKNSLNSLSLNSKNINPEKKIFESITGTIKGIPKTKYLVEYGSTKGYKRPNIKKGKDFVHNPEILIEGTIIGKKKIPLTLKSLFEGNINENIILNNDSIKNKKYKLKEEEIYNIIFSNELNKEIEVKQNHKLKDSKRNEIIKQICLNNENEEPNLIQLENISGRIEGSSKIKYLVEYGSTNGYKRPNIKKGKDFIHNPEILIEGIIEGKKNMDKKEDEKISNTNVKGSKVNLKRSERLNFIEYGSSLNFVRPEIKKGLDFYHEPKVKFSKKDIDSSFDIVEIPKSIIIEEKK